MSAMKVKEVPVSEVLPYHGNPRNNDDAVEAVAASIREFGWQQPIVVDADMTVIVGHTRLKAAQRLGLATVPVHVASELTPEQVAAYRLADNKVGELATWDMNALALELDGLSCFDMGQFGFDELPTSDLFGDEFELSNNDGPQFKTVSLNMSAEMFDEFNEILGEVHETRFVAGSDNSNKVLEVLCQWAGR